jgi:hypothetical protein
LAGQRAGRYRSTVDAVSLSAGDPRIFDAARNRSARTRNVLVILGTLLAIYSGPLIWPAPPDKPGMPAPLMIVMVAGLCGLTVLPVSAILSRHFVVDRDPVRHRDVLAGHTMYGWRNVDLDRLVSIRVIDFGRRGFPQRTYLVLRDEHGARLAVLWPDSVINRALRRAVRRHRASLRLSPLAAALIEVEREYRDGPDCRDAVPAVKMTLAILPAVLLWVVENVAIN